MSTILKNYRVEIWCAVLDEMDSAGVVQEAFQAYLAGGWASLQRR